MNKKTEFGGNVSVRKRESDKPLIIIGQDEIIFKQYIFNNKSWTLLDGTREMLPKDEGTGIMVSAMVSRALGFGSGISKEQLDIVNSKRRGTL